jgi:hypothetical protein
MKLLFDLNVLLDVALRPRTYPMSLTLYHRIVASPLHQGTFAACGYTTLYYFMHRDLGAHDARNALLEWHKRFTLLPFTERMAQAAHRLRMADFEDACIAITAFEGQCDLIATRNVEDFQTSPIPAHTPEEILVLL